MADRQEIRKAVFEELIRLAGESGTLNVANPVESHSIIGAIDRGIETAMARTPE